MELTSILLALLCLFVGAAVKDAFNGGRTNKLEIAMATLVANQDNLTKSQESDRDNFVRHMELHSEQTKLMTETLNQNNILIQAVIAKKNV